MNDKTTQDNPDLPAQEGRAAWQSHWDRPRVHVALVTAQYQSGREEELCTYCLDRRKELHPRCLAPGCTCDWHTPGAVENPPLIPREDPVGTVGLAWRSAKPWAHSRMMRRSFFPDWLDERSSRARRKENRPPVAVYWLKAAEDGSGAPAAAKTSKPVSETPLPERAVPPPPQSAPANSIYRRGQAPYRFQVMKTLRRKATRLRFERGIPGLRRALVFSACAGIAVAALLLGGERLRNYSEPSVAQNTATAFPDFGLQQETLTTSPMPASGPVDRDQLVPPCPRGSAPHRGACWIEFAVEKEAPLDELRSICYDAPNVYVFSYEDCMKNRRMFKARLKNPDKERRSTNPKTGQKP